MVLSITARSLNCQDQAGAKTVLEKLNEQFCPLKVILGDSAYGRSGLPDWAKDSFGSILQTVFRPVGVNGFVILPKRWIVERTCAWLACYRRNSKDYEKNPESSEAFTYISMIAMMPKRLATASTQFQNTFLIKGPHSHQRSTKMRLAKIFSVQHLI